MVAEVGGAFGRPEHCAFVEALVNEDDRLLVPLPTDATGYVARGVIKPLVLDIQKPQTRTGG